MSLHAKIMSSADKLFTHELLANKSEGSAEGDGVHLGLMSRDTVVQAHTPGETSEQIYEWISLHAAAELAAQHDAVMEQMAKALEEAKELLTALDIHNGYTGVLIYAALAAHAEVTK